MVDIPLPRTSGYQRLLTEEVKSEQMRFSISEGDGDRRGRWSGRLDGSSSLTYEVTFDALPYSRADPRQRRGRQVPEQRRRRPRRLARHPAHRPGRGRARRASWCSTTKNKAALAQQVYEFVAREIGALRSTAPMDAVTVIREGRGNDLGRARLFCALTRANGLPCRVMAGIPLANGRQDQFRYWNEVYLGGGWVPFDVVARHAGAPAARPPLARPQHRRRAGQRHQHQRLLLPLRRAVRARDLRRAGRAAGSPPRSICSTASRCSSCRVQIQHTLRILLLVPLGALAMCVLRNVVGLKHLRHVHAGADRAGLHRHRPGVGHRLSRRRSSRFALLSRLLIQRLYLLLAARIAFILTLVVLLMVAVFIVGDKIGMPSAGVGAFPFVIMTMIVERISVGLEEEGAANTLRRIGATLAAIYLTYARHPRRAACRRSSSSTRSCSW